MIAPMMLAGIPVADRHVLELARRLRSAALNDAAERLEDAYDREAKIVALTVAEREAIISVLNDCPDGLAELRATLLVEHSWRLQEGLTGSHETG
jgi:hypothetical protein